MHQMLKDKMKRDGTPLYCLVGVFRKILQGITTPTTFKIISMLDEICQSR